MQIRFDAKLELEMVTILPGEYHATRERRVIATVLGSCVAVALYDSGSGVAGMNHFMLPDTISEDRFYLSRSGKYGMYAMELLINDMLKLGAGRRGLRAKVFGGGSVLSQVDGFATRVPENNVRFALEYLEAEQIPVTARDVGGNEARKIYFFTGDARVRLKRLSKTLAQPVETKELRYLERIRARRAVGSDVTLF